MATVVDEVRRQREGLICGVSDWTLRLREQIKRFASYNSSVLISGPSGTGKELIARSLHAHSLRAANRFLAVDCASLTGELMASQLFGHLEGAFTGASRASLGCFRAAHQGTIFLDEIGEMELSLQAKLLRVLQERVVVPVGGHDGIPVDVRVIAATNRDLEAEVSAGRFREDLFYRLNVVCFPTKSLADRREDIVPLVGVFLEQLAQDGMPKKKLTPGAIEFLEVCSWPGNVRQLKNFLEQAVVGCNDPMISLQHVRSLLETRVGAGSRPIEVESQQPSEAIVSPVHLDDREWNTLDDIERQHILQTLEHTYYNRSAAARLLGVSRQALLRKVVKHGIETPSLA